jgi:hypothetical protein
MSSLGEKQEQEMAEYLLELKLAHWLIIAGLALIVLGLLGMVVRPRKQPESPTPGEATSVDEVRMLERAHQKRSPNSAGGRS